MTHNAGKPMLVSLGEDNKVSLNVYNDPKKEARPLGISKFISLK